MMKVIYFIIFRSAVSTPILAAAIFSTLGTVFISFGFQLLFSKLADVKKMREVELAFSDFKVITSNLTWDNQFLQKLVLDSCFYKELELMPQYESAVTAIEAKLHEMIEGSQKYRDGTVVKQFNEEDTKLKSLVVKDLEDEELNDWVEVSIDQDLAYDFLPPPDI
mmetsp:Transcript_8146/g.7729  ORF Transcript_8146/g.7729 Transcript_8146/m.7729 type:complete len:165 (+) Transcript_8146:758-1252(+)